MKMENGLTFAFSFFIKKETVILPLGGNQVHSYNYKNKLWSAKTIKNVPTNSWLINFFELIFLYYASFLKFKILLYIRGTRK